MSTTDIIGVGLEVSHSYQCQGGHQLFLSGPTRIQDAIWIILSTSLGERLMRETFGAGVNDYVFQSNSDVVRAQLAAAVSSALAQWEPRIKQVNVSVQQGTQPSQVLIVIDYQISSTNELFNLVYPLVPAGGSGLMPLPEINLDDRTFEQLYQELIRRIPAYTPEWTDYNDSDPGVTLMQLFAWLAEILVYRHQSGAAEEFHQVPGTRRDSFDRACAGGDGTAIHAGSKGFGNFCSGWNPGGFGQWFRVASRWSSRPTLIFSLPGLRWSPSRATTVCSLPTIPRRTPWTLRPATRR